jgi:hypothetical protein
MVPFSVNALTFTTPPAAPTGLEMPKTRTMAKAGSFIKMKIAEKK